MQASDTTGGIPLAAAITAQRRVDAIQQTMMEQLVSALPASGDTAEISSESLALLASDGIT